MTARLKDPIRGAFKAALTADSSFQSKQWQVLGLTFTARYNYFYLAVRKIKTLV